MASSSQGSHKLLYSLVARGTTVLAEYRSAGPALGLGQHVSVPYHSTDPGSLCHMPWFPQHRFWKCANNRSTHSGASTIRGHVSSMLSAASTAVLGCVAALDAHGLFCCDGCCGAWKLSAWFLPLKQPCKQCGSHLSASTCKCKVLLLQSSVHCQPPSPPCTCTHHTTMRTEIANNQSHCVMHVRLDDTVACVQCGKTHAAHYPAALLCVPV